KKTSHKLMLLALVLATSTVAVAQRRPSGASGREMTIPVTVHPHNERTRQAAQSLGPDDFAVRENRRLQRITSVKRPQESPLQLAVLIQDDLISGVNNERSRIQEFIRQLPDGSRVLTGYLTVGSLRVAEDFTTDRDRAARSLRVIKSTTDAAPFNPYIEVIEALRRFDSLPSGKRAILLISDGLDASRGLRSASPSQSVDLDRAISEAQRRGVAVFAFYAPSVGFTNESRIAANYGQGSLNRIAGETGGEAFFAGNTFVSFDPYFKELEEALGNLWLVTYESTTPGSSFRRIEVTSEPEVHLHHPAGYRPKGK
ncbi:MAG TPA: hypothetical protein VJQ56_15520, partial [Blastocatellia bacterium]|nr:hypothetical protein [Blastocatellia bacterium]